MNLSGLTIGSLELTPSFDKDVTEYTATTVNATNTVTATAEDENAEITVEVNDVEIDNGGTATWTGGLNEVVITVTNGENSKEYSVVVTKPLTFTFSPTGLTANATNGLSANSVSVTDSEAVISTVSADNEHITVSESEGTISLSCDDDTILVSDNLPITVSVVGTIGGVAANGSFEITYEA